MDLDSAQAVLGFNCGSVLRANSYACVVSSDVSDVLSVSGGALSETLSRAVRAKDIVELQHAEPSELGVFAGLVRTRRLTTLECAVVATAFANGLDLLVSDARPVLRAIEALDVAREMAVYSLPQILRSIADLSNCPTAKAAYSQLARG